MFSLDFYFFLFQFARVGVYGTEVTPVPIPNTEVKLCREDDTWLATAREIISMPAHILSGSPWLPLNCIRAISSVG